MQLTSDKEENTWKTEIWRR